MIEETNPRSSSRQYDEIGNLNMKRSLSEVHKEYQYDFSDRLIGEEFIVGID
jgi:hypothetical protein